MTEFEKMQSGALYLYPDHEDAFLAVRDERLVILTTCARGRKKKTPCAAGEEVRCAGGEGCHIEPPFAANLGGMFVHFGRNVYANFGFTLVDDAPIYVGDGTLFGPNVTLITAGHPIDPEQRGIFFASRFISAETAGSARTAPLRAIFRPTSSHTAARARL